MAARLKDYTAAELKAAAYQLSQSQWHKDNKQMSIDNLIAPSKVGRWYTAAQADGFKTPTNKKQTVEERKALAEQSRLEQAAINAANLAKMRERNNNPEELTV